MIKCIGRSREGKHFTPPLTPSSYLKGKTFVSTKVRSSLLSTTKDQATLAQSFPAAVSRKLGHNHDTDILRTDANFG